MKIKHIIIIQIITMALFMATMDAIIRGPINQVAWQIEWQAQRAAIINAPQIERIEKIAEFLGINK